MRTKTTMKFKTLIASICLVTSQSLIAESLINDGSVENRVYTRVGIEPTTMLAVGYQQNVQIGELKNKLTSYVEWNTSLFRFGPDNSDLKIGGIIPVYENGNFKIVNDFNFSVGSTTNQNFDSLKLAAADEVSIGWFSKKWFTAATAEYEKILINKLTHTQYYRDRYYEDAVDGWYKGGGGTLQFGVTGGMTIMETVDVHVEVKKPFTEKFDNLTGAPLHVNLGLGYRF